MSRSLGSLRIDLQALTGKFEANFKTASNVVEKFGVVATRVGRLATGAISRMGSAFSSLRSAIFSVHGLLTGFIAIVGGARLIRAFDDAAEVVDNLGKKARVVGLTVEQMSALRLAAKEGGLDFDTLAKLVGKATKNIGTFIVTGGGPAADAIRRLGINVRSASGEMREVNDLLPEIAVAFERITDEGERLSLAEAIFGREGGQQFVEWLEDSGGFMADLATQTERASRLGVLFSEAQFQKLREYRNAVERISEAWLGMRVRIMTELAPALESLADRTALLLARIGEFGANLASVIIAAINREDLFKSAGEPDLNVALEALKRLVTSFFEALWTEVSTRIKFFFARVWQFISDAISDVIAGAGEFLTGALDEISGVLGIALGAAASAIGRALTAAAERLGSLAGNIASRWAEAGWALREYGEELESTRKAHWDLFRLAIERIDELGRKYREARSAVEGHSAAADAAVSAAARVASAWDNFFTGVREGWRKLREEANDFVEFGRSVFTTFAQQLSSGLSSALASGEASFRNFGQTAMQVLANVGKAIAELMLRFVFMRAISSLFGGIFDTPVQTTGPGANQIPDIAGSSAPRFAAKGGVFGFARGGIASGMLAGPVVFPFSRHIGVAGEAGPEVGFAPLRRIGGELGVRAVGGDVIVQIIDQRRSGEKIEAQQTRYHDGRKMLRIMIRDEVKQGIGDGTFDRALSGAYGIQRRGIRR